MVMETLIATLETPRIELRHIPLEIQRHELLQAAENGKWTADDLLNAYARRVFRSTGENKSQAAKILGWSVNTFKRRLNQYSLKLGMEPDGWRCERYIPSGFL